MISNTNISNDSDEGFASDEVDEKRSISPKMKYDNYSENQFGIAGNSFNNAFMASNKTSFHHKDYS